MLALFPTRFDYSHMTQPSTSKTAKKKASPPPLKIPEPTLETQDQVSAEEGGPTAPAAPESVPVRPSGSLKRKIRRQFEIPRVTFRRLVQEIAADYKSDLRFQRDAIEALQEASEILVSERFARCSELVDLCKLDTVRDEHWRFVQGEKALVPCSGTS